MYNKYCVGLSDQTDETFISMDIYKREEILFKPRIILIKDPKNVKMINDLESFLKLVVIEEFFKKNE